MSEHGPTAQGARAAIDPWVFFIAAGISLAFVLWGVIDADGVGAVADDVLTWIISTFGWVFVIGTAGFLVFAVVLAFSRFGRVRLGARRRPARVPHRLVDRDDVQRRDGHRADVLRRRRADLAHDGAARRHRGGGHRRGRPAGDVDLLLPLGAASVGDLRDRRPRARVLHLPQGHAEPDQLGLLPAARRPREGADRAVDRHPRHLRDAVRERDLARPRRAPDQQRARLPVGRRAERRDRGDDHRRAHARRSCCRPSRASTAASSGSATGTWSSRSCSCSSCSSSGRRCSSSRRSSSRSAATRR